jgi:hypothetical protein
MRPITCPETCTAAAKTGCAECNGKGCVKLGPTECADGEVVRVYHDECICGANEGRKTYWGEKGDRLFFKSKGASIMISGFICACHGRMVVQPDQVDAFRAFVDAKHAGVDFTMCEFTTPDGRLGYHSFTTIVPGKNKDGWWRGEDVVVQTRQVIAIFEFLHNGKGVVGLFVYDNSTNHSCVPPTALHTGAGVNKGPGGKNAPGAWTTNPKTMPGASETTPIQIPNMRNGWYYDEDGKRVVQQMHYADGPFEGVFKGMEKILVERGLANNGLRGECTGGKKAQGCKVKDVPVVGFCCCKQLLRQQPDFVSQPSALEELIEGLGHRTMMLPKCHPELNPIEQFWAAIKEHLRRVCGYTFPDLRKHVPLSYDQVPLDQVLRYFTRTLRFEALYRFEADGGMALPTAVREYAMKKYKRHRTVPESLLRDVEVALETRVTKLEKDQHQNPGKRTDVRLAVAKATLLDLRQVPSSRGAPMGTVP